MTELSSTVAALAELIESQGEKIATEEAVKTAVVLPLLQALGYDVFNPGEVVPEFNADVSGKKREKVDYAIIANGEVRILIECKSLSTELKLSHLSQLFRYFTVTNAMFGILTNGRRYEIYSDLDEPNILDKQPFFVFDLSSAGSNSLSEFRKFSKSEFDVDAILQNAERLKFVSATKRVLKLLMKERNDDFSKLVAGFFHDGRITSQVRDSVSSAIRIAFKELIREAVQERLSSALQSNSEDTTESEEQDELQTTQEEIEGYLTVKAVVRNVIDSSRVHIRDAKSYCAILVDDNNRKPLVRLHFNRKKKYIGLFDHDAEERVHIVGLDDIYSFGERLRATAMKYDLD